MNKHISKNIEAKMTDYTRFGNVLLAISVFFFLGVIIPGNTKENLQIIVMMIATVIFLGSAFYFHAKVRELKDKLSK